jgi:hypothetical protein
VIGDHARADRPEWPQLVRGDTDVATPIWLYWLRDRPAQNPPAQRFLEARWDAAERVDAARSSKGSEAYH